MSHQAILQQFIHACFISWPDEEPDPDEYERARHAWEQVLRLDASALDTLGQMLQDESEARLDAVFWTFSLLRDGRAVIPLLHVMCRRLG